MSRFVWLIKARDWRRSGSLTLVAVVVCVLGFVASVPWWWLAVWIGLAGDGLLRLVRPVFRLSRHGAITVVRPIESAVVAMAFIAVGAIAVPHSEHTRSTLWSAGLFIFVANSAHMVRSPVRLTSAGIATPSLLGRVYIPWEAISTRQIAVDRHVPLWLEAPELVVRHGWTRAFGNLVIVPSDGLRPDDLAAVLDFYVGHPQARAAIGSSAGLADLKRVLAEPPQEAVATI